RRHDPARAYLNSAIMADGVVQEQVMGRPQGVIAAGECLARLDEMDKELGHVGPAFTAARLASGGRDSTRALARSRPAAVRLLGWPGRPADQGRFRADIGPKSPGRRRSVRRERARPLREHYNSRTR